MKSSLKSPSTGAKRKAKTKAAVGPVMSNEAAEWRAPTHDELAARAHAIWMSEGCPTGRDHAHWLQAEEEFAARIPPESAK